MNPSTDARWLPALVRGTRPIAAEELHRQLMQNLPWAAHPPWPRCWTPSAWQA